jgi:probable rRNA maturation factor
MAVLLARTKLLPAGATLALKKKAGRVLRLLNQRSAELSIALVSDREIQALNAAYRRQNKPTDVLSFPADERLPTGGRLLGDVILSVEQARKQARARRRTLEQELELLLIHGILHLLGYDHERSPADEKIMRLMERRLRRTLSQERC